MSDGLINAIHPHSHYPSPPPVVVVVVVVGVVVVGAIESLYDLYPIIHERRGGYNHSNLKDTYDYVYDYMHEYV